MRLTPKSCRSRTAGLRSHHLVRLAEAYMRSNLHRPLRLPDVCRAVPTSERTLEYAFQAVHGIGPMRWLARLRLERVRQALASAEPGSITVRAAAKVAGLHHMGHFSAAYRLVYGECPSDTLRRSSAVAPRTEARIVAGRSNG